MRKYDQSTNHSMPIYGEVNDIRTEAKAGKQDILLELDTVDEELKKRDESIRSKLEDGMGAITAWMRDLEEKFENQRDEIKKQFETESVRKLAEAEKKMADDLKKRDERIVRIEADFEKKADELKKRFESELRKKDEETLRTIEVKNQEKEIAVLEAYRAIETQSDIISKIMEKNEKLMLEVLAELNISIEDLRKMLDAGNL